MVTAVFPLSYLVLLLLIGAERVVELVVSRRNERWSLAQSGVESGHGHFPVMVVLHTGLLVGSLLEAWLAPRDFVPWLGWPTFVLVLLAQAVRTWCISSLGRRWNTRIIVIPGLSPIRRGPYRWLRHPNYVAVVVEGAAIPLVHSAWVTALVFTVANAFLLRVRIKTENAALAAAAAMVTR